MALTFGILTVSDTCFAKTNEDRSGPKLAEIVKRKFPDSKIVFQKIVPDEQTLIQCVLTAWSQNDQCMVILTTGGTGFGPRDVTPEATKAVIDKETLGISTAMLVRSLNVTDKAMLSRATSGIKDNTLIINLPGSVKGASECFEFICDTIPHAVALITNNLSVVRKTHSEMQGCSPSKVKVNVANRSRHSPWTMVEVDEALKIIFDKCPKSDVTEMIDIDKSFGRILAVDVISADPLPPFPASIKDGYAVRSCDAETERNVRGAIAAGDETDIDANAPLKPNECVRISTGAAVPAGADAVVQVEDTALVKASDDGSQELQIKINVMPKHGQDIRPIGSDISANSVVLTKGDMIDVGHIGVLATCGRTNVSVFSRPTIGVISTGNELQDPKEKLKPGRIRDSNKLTLIHLFKKYHYEANDCGIARDDPNSVKRVLQNALEKHDIVITTGGVSMGEYDLVKNVLVQDFNATIHFGRVNMKPGKPTTFATCVHNNKFKLIFGLPGNPVSATVTALLFVFPAVKHYENRMDRCFANIPNVQIQGNYKNTDSRPEYARAKVEYKNNVFTATVMGNQISSRLNSFVGANSLVYVPPAGKDDVNFALLLDASI